MIKLGHALILCLCYFPFLARAEDYTIVYYKNIFGHLHLSPYEISTSLTTLSCGFPVKLFNKQEGKLKDWKHVQVGEDKGYIYHSYLSDSKIDCFQSTYNVFFNSFELDLTDLYYWGRLSDQYIEVNLP